MASNNAAAVLVKATGSVYVERQGTRISLAEGDTIHATDKVVTDQGSTAEIRFNDDSTASLSPGTTLEVKDFSFGEGAQPSFILNLAEGTMRSVSGELVRQNPEAFKIVTPQATVGIRGTELFTAVMPGGQEVHAVLHIGKGHIVSITSHDGRSIVMDSALQAVNMSDGEHGALVKQTFQLNELQQVIKNIAPTQVQKPIQPQGVEGEAIPGQSDPSGQSGQTDAAAAASTSTVVVIIHEDESASTAQIAAENTATGADTTPADGTSTLLSAVEQLQGALADAGFTVAVASESTLQNALAQGKNPSDVLVSETVQENISQVIEKPLESGKNESLTPPDAGTPPGTGGGNNPGGGDNPGTGGGNNPGGGDNPGTGGDNPGTGGGDNPGGGGDNPGGGGDTPPPDTDVVYATYAGTDFGSRVVATDKSVAADRELHVTVNGDVDFDAELIANGQGLTSTDSTQGQTAGDVIIVNGELRGTLYGDTKTVTATDNQLKEVFGSDSITVDSVVEGGIYGDTGEVSAGSTGTIEFAGDEITVTHDMNDGVIVGDVYEVKNTGANTGLLLNFGEDEITIGGDLLNGAIYGDAVSTAQNIYGFVPTFAKDIITVEGDMGAFPGASIVGDIGVINGGGGSFEDGYRPITMGSDHISVNGTLRSGSIYGDSEQAAATPSNPALAEGNDPGKYVVACGHDQITVGSMSGGRIVGDIADIEGGKEIRLGNDTITVTGTMTGGEIYGDFVSNTSSATLPQGTSSAPYGNDTITVGGISLTASNEAAIYGGMGADRISTGSIRAVGDTELVIDGGSGNDRIQTGDITAAGSSLISIKGGLGFDTIDVGSMTIGGAAEVKINGGDGSDLDSIDTITVSNVTVTDSGKLVIDAGGGSSYASKDTIEIGAINVTDGNVTLQGGMHSDVFRTGDITTSGSGQVRIDGKDGTNTMITGDIKVTGGNVTLQGGTANDTFSTDTITTAGSGSVVIDGGVGPDTIIVGGYTGSAASSLTIKLGADNVSDSLSLNASTIQGNINITGYNITSGAGANDDVISISGLNVPSSSYRINAAGAFELKLSDTATVTITGNFGSLGAADVYNRLTSGI